MITEILIKRVLPLEFKVGYIFADKKLLLKSMLHSSYVNENKHHGLKSNERLEYLGDAVLELIISQYLMEHYSDKDEGVLSLKRSYLVREHTLAKIARKIRLQNYIVIGCGEEKDGGNKRDSVLSDALEAFFGAIYLDGGLEPAKKIILKLFEPLFLEIDQIEHNFNFKNQLQEYVQVNYRTLPYYKVASHTGPEHQRRFRVHVFINKKYITFGTGTSIKKSEQTASKNALNLLKKWALEGRIWQKKI